jgi:hypothetical protein
MSPNRLVALLTPLVFAPLAGAIAAWLANHAPGVDVSPDDLQQIFIAGALIALAPAAQWLHGWQKYEARQADADLAVQVAQASKAAHAVSEASAIADDFGATSEADAVVASDLEPGAGGGEPGDGGAIDFADEFDMLDEDLAADGRGVGAGA